MFLGLGEACEYGKTAAKLGPQGVANPRQHDAVDEATQDVGGFGHRVWRAQRLAISCAAKPFAGEFVSRVWATLPSRSNIRTAGGVVFCTTFATENLAFDPFRIDIIGFAAPF